MVATVVGEHRRQRDTPDDRDHDAGGDRTAPGRVASWRLLEPIDRGVRRPLLVVPGPPRADVPGRTLVHASPPRTIVPENPAGGEGGTPLDRFRPLRHRAVTSCVGHDSTVTLTALPWATMSNAESTSSSGMS